MSPNRRVTIALMREEPPLPDNLTPKGTSSPNYSSVFPGSMQ
jgi:hypothetical protein